MKAHRGHCSGRDNYAALFLGGGTLAPERRASDNPIAIACFGFVTLRPLPERKRPRLNSCISSPTFAPAFGPYRRPEPLELRAALDDFFAEVLRPADFLPADFARVPRPPEDFFAEVFFAAVLRLRVPVDSFAAVFRAPPLRVADVREPDDFLAALREPLAFFVAIGLASYVIRRTSKTNRLRDKIRALASELTLANQTNMITVRPSEERGHFDHGWLNTYHTFSFASYHDPEHMHFRSLRVINEDKVAPGQGFPRHPHRDMEIITYILEGQLEHRDSLGNGSKILPGDGQRMSAGTGILHSEYNPSLTETAHLLQIWILPETNRIKPAYEQKSFPEEEKVNRWRLIAARDGQDGAVKIHQDVKLYVTRLQAGNEVSHTLEPGRGAWLQIAKGSVELNGTALNQGDGAAIENESQLTVRATEDAEVLLFDLA